MLALFILFSTQISIKTFLQFTDAHVVCSSSGECDLSIVDSGFEYIKSRYNPDFIAWTGDSLFYEACSVPSLEGQTQIPQISNLVEKYFPNVPVIPVFGNHDACPSTVFPLNDTDFYENFLEPDKWGKFIFDQTEKATFLKGGYYSRRVSDSLVALAVNSILWVSPNWEVVNHEDPADQFEWLSSAFEQARETGDKVMIFSHVPPGHEPNITRVYNLPKFNSRFVELLEEFSSQIVGMFCGHLHYNAILADPKKFGRAIYASPAFSRVLGMPGIRLYTFNETSNEMVDYTQLYLEKDGSWRGYNQSSQFSVEGNDAGMLYDYVNANFDDYVRIFKYGSGKTCDKECRKSLWCSMKLLLEDYEECLQDGD